MEKPNATTVAYYEALLPQDPRVVPGQMFGHPCAFINGNMFFGTFAQTLIARVGEVRAATLDSEDFAVFEPMKGRAWKAYVQFDPLAVDEEAAAAVANDALHDAAKLPPKVKNARKKPANKAKK